MYTTVSLYQLNAVVAGNGSYIIRPCGHDLHSPTPPSFRIEGNPSFLMGYPILPDSVMGMHLSGQWAVYPIQLMGGYPMQPTGGTPRYSDIVAGWWYSSPQLELYRVPPFPSELDGGALATRRAICHFTQEDFLVEPSIFTRGIQFWAVV